MARIIDCILSIAYITLSSVVYLIVKIDDLINKKRNI